MTEDQFDRCPECGAIPQFGLRCHPKFSLKVGVSYGKDDADYVAYYAHDERAIRHLENVFANDPFSSDTMVMERWNSDTKKWEEFH